MSSGLYALLAAGVVLGLTSFAVWMAVRQARVAGRAASEAETNRRMADNAEAQGKIMAERREQGDASNRLGDGSF